jgi:phosphatidylserine/phosphatidylglycerophosphate/cardiolipin synthase-like enzyme
MIRVLEERAKAEVEVRIIGGMTHHSDRLKVRKSPQRLHTRTIVRDRKLVFIGSQSLRTAELDSRREVGIIFRDRKIVDQVIKIFQEDWAATERSKKAAAEEEMVPAAKVAKKVAKAVTKGLPPVAAVLEGIVKEVVGEKTDVALNSYELQESVQDAVREAVKGVIQQAVEQQSGMEPE